MKPARTRNRAGVLRAVEARGRESGTPKYVHKNFLITLLIFTMQVDKIYISTQE